MIIEIQTPGVNLVVIPECKGWVITYLRLFDVTPDDAPNAKVIGGDISIWILCFDEDQLQAVNKEKGLILDVGWYPGCDPNGSYAVKLISFDAMDPDNSAKYDWFNPLITFKTRSLEELLIKIKQMMEENP